MTEGVLVMRKYHVLLHTPLKGWGTMMRPISANLNWETNTALNCCYRGWEVFLTVLARYSSRFSYSTLHVLSRTINVGTIIVENRSSPSLMFLRYYRAHSINGLIRHRDSGEYDILWVNHLEVSFSRITVYVLCPHEYGCFRTARTHPFSIMGPGFFPSFFGTNPLIYWVALCNKI